MIDELTHDDVVWRLWEDLMFYIGHFRLFNTIVTHFSERYLRPFGFVHHIPPSIFNRVFDVNMEWTRYLAHVTEIYHRLCLATYPSDFQDGYIERLYRVSHPFLVHLTEIGVPHVPKFDVMSTAARAFYSQLSNLQTMIYLIQWRPKVLYVEPNDDTIESIMTHNNVT